MAIQPLEISLGNEKLSGANNTFQYKPTHLYSEESPIVISAAYLQENVYRIVGLGMCENALFLQLRNYILKSTAKQKDRFFKLMARLKISKELDLLNKQNFLKQWFPNCESGTQRRVFLVDPTAAEQNSNENKGDGRIR